MPFSAALLVAACVIALVVVALVLAATAGDVKAAAHIRSLRDGTPAHPSGPRDGADRYGRPE